MSQDGLVSSERRATAKWEQLSHLTGIAMGGKQTGWDRLAQDILGDPSLRFKAVRRMEAIVNLCRLLTRLSEAHFVVLALRYGLTVDDQDVPAQSRQAVSEKLKLGVSRIAQLEQEALTDLQRRVPTEFPALADFVYRADGHHVTAGDALRTVH
jgi:hypothetical protein